jgi:hypothetical protein
MQRAYWLIASVVVAGCTGGPPPTPGGTGGTLPTPRATDVGTPSGSPVEKTIGPAGGTLASADGLLTIDVPAGALAADTQLGIQPLTSTAPNGLGPGFRLTPAGTTLSSPVTLTFKPTTEQLAGTVLALTGIGYQDASGFWRWMRGVERDEANGLVSVATTHFSDWSFLAGVQLRPPSASVQTGETLTLTAVDCYTEEEQLAPLPPRPGEEPLAPLPPRFDCAWDTEHALRPFAISNWSVNAVKGGNPTVGTIIVAPGRAGRFTAPQSTPNPATVTVSVDVENVTLDGRKFPKAVLLSNVTIGVQTYTGTFQFVLEDATGSATITWTLVSSMSTMFERPYRASGTIVADITYPNCDPIHVERPIYSNLDYWDMLVYTAISPVDPGTYSFRVEATGADVTVFCPGGGGYTQTNPISYLTFELPAFSDCGSPDPDSPDTRSFSFTDETLLSGSCSPSDSDLLSSSWTFTAE